jgi:adenylate cyclase
VRDHFVLIELDRIAVRGRASQSAIFTVISPAARRLEPEIAALEECHARLLASLRSGETAAAAALIERCRTIAASAAPSLGRYYAKMADSLAVPPPAHPI